MKATKQAIHELKHHSPFTALAAILAVLIFLIVNKTANYSFGANFFYGAHFIHILASAMVTTALFYKYKKNYTQSILVGIIGAIIIGSLSDVLFPYLGGTFLNFVVNFHLPILESPILVITFAFIGSIMGIFIKRTKEAHFAHVILSVLASLFYLTLFISPQSYILGIDYLLIFLIVFVAVIIPCCLSDILFPFFFLGQKIKKCNC